MTDAERIVELEARVEALTKIVGMLTVENRGINPTGKDDGLSEFAVEVCRVVERIPFGETKGYDEIATLAGTPKGGRNVGRALDSGLLYGKRIPWWRVLRSDGSMATHPSRMQRELLIAEGHIPPPQWRAP